MADAIFPETGSVFIGSTLITFDTTSFKEAGGDQKRAFIKTMNRRNRRFNEPRKDYSVSFEISVRDTKYSVFYDTVGSLGSISLQFDGSYTLNYFNMYNTVFIHNAKADDRLLGNITFDCSPYDQNGSPNRVIS